MVRRTLRESCWRGILWGTTRPSTHSQQFSSTTRPGSPRGGDEPYPQPFEGFQKRGGKKKKCWKQWNKHQPGFEPLRTAARLCSPACSPGMFVPRWLRLIRTARRDARYWGSPQTRGLKLWRQQCLVARSWHFFQSEGGRAGIRTHVGG